MTLFFDQTCESDLRRTACLLEVVSLTVKVKRSKDCACALNNRGRIVFFHEMFFFFGPWQFLRGKRMDISGEVADIHMRTDAKNWVTTARTIHLPEQRETIHMIFCCDRKPLQGALMILLTFQVRIVCQICLTKSSAKAHNLITAVNTGWLLEVGVHPNFRTLMEHKAFCEMRHTIFLLSLTQSSFLQLSRSVSAPAPTHDLDLGSSVWTLAQKSFIHPICTIPLTHSRLHGVEHSSYLVWIWCGDDSWCFKLCFSDVRFIANQVRECVCCWSTQCKLCQFCLNQLELNSCCSAQRVLCRRQSAHQVLVVVVPSFVISASCARDCVFMTRDMLRIMAQENVTCSSRPT